MRFKHWWELRHNCSPVTLKPGFEAAFKALTQCKSFFVLHGNISCRANWRIQLMHDLFYLFRRSNSRPDQKSLITMFYFFEHFCVQLLKWLSKNNSCGVHDPFTRLDSVPVSLVWTYWTWRIKRTASKSLQEASVPWNGKEKWKRTNDIRFWFKSLTVKDISILCSNSVLKLLLWSFVRWSLL